MEGSFLFFRIRCVSLISDESVVPLHYMHVWCYVVRCRTRTSMWLDQHYMRTFKRRLPQMIYGDIRMCACVWAGLNPTIRELFGNVFVCKSFQTLTVHAVYESILKAMNKVQATGIINCYDRVKFHQEVNRISTFLQQ